MSANGLSSVAQFLCRINVLDYHCRDLKIFRSVFATAASQSQLNVLLCTHAVLPIYCKVLTDSDSEQIVILCYKIHKHILCYKYIPSI